MKIISMRSVVATAAVVTLLASPTAFAASSCVTAKDEAALQTRLVQTELMVAALTCKRSSQYNDFVTRHQKELMKTHTALRAFFKKRYAKGGEDELNSFITRLANDSSKRSIANVRAFCENSATMFDGALSANISGFTDFAVAQPVSKLHGFVPCTATQSASASPTQDGAKRVPLPVRKPAAFADATSESSNTPAAPVLISH